MEQWDQEFVDLVSPGHITFTGDGRGDLHFGAVDVSLDWRADATGNRMDFAFEGFDEGDEVSGTGWAELNGGKPTGRLAFDSGDESGVRGREGRHSPSLMARCGVIRFENQ